MDYKRFKLECFPQKCLFAVCNIFIEVASQLGAAIPSQNKLERLSQKYFFIMPNHGGGEAAS
jgi:hypothetical protein